LLAGYRVCESES